MANNDYTPLLGKTPHNSRYSKLVKALAGLTVEPALFLHGLAHATDQVILTQISIDKICQVQFRYSQDICDNLETGNYDEEQDRVQRMTSNYNAYRHWVEYIPALFVSIVLGSWGDIRGRRFPVILPVIGSFLSSLCLMANAYWWHLPASMLYVSYIPVGMTGGSIGIASASNAYLSATSQDRSRTTKLSSVEWLTYLCYPLGMYTSMFIYQKKGYVWVYSLQAIVYFVCFIYLLVCLKEPPSIKKDSVENSKSVCAVLSPAQLKKTFTVTWRRSDGKISVPLIIHTLIIFLVVFIMGVKNQYYLFTRKMFEWQYEDYTKWLMFQYLVSALGLFFLMVVLSYYWRVDDSILGFMGASSYMFFYVLFGTAPYPWVLYLAALASLLGVASMVSSRGSISKIVGQDELGAVFSTLAVVECVVLMVAPSVYTIIYSATLDVFPGTLFLVIAGIAAVVSCLHIWLQAHYPPQKLKA